MRKLLSLFALWRDPDWRKLGVLALLVSLIGIGGWQLQTDRLKTKGVTAHQGTASVPVSDATGTPRFWATVYDSTAAYTSNELLFGLPAYVGSGFRTEIIAPNSNQDRVFGVIGAVKCGTASSTAAPLPASNGKVGGYFAAQADSDATNCAPMGLNALVNGRYPANPSVFAIEADYNAFGDVPFGATVGSYAAINAVNGGPNKGGAFYSTAVTNFPTNAMQVGANLVHWNQIGAQCLHTSGAADVACYFAGPIQPASTSLGTQQTSTEYRAQDHRWNGSADVQDIARFRYAPLSDGSRSCWEFTNASNQVIFRSCDTQASGGPALVVGGPGASVLTNGTLSVGGFAAVNGIGPGTATLTYTSIAAQTGQEQTLTISGASTTNFGVSCSPRSTLGNANLSWQAWVSSSNTVSVRVVNPTAGPITPNAVAWGCTVTQ